MQMKLEHRDSLGCILADDSRYRNEWYNSKPGRLHDAEAADEATQGGTVRG